MGRTADKYEAYRERWMMEVAPRVEGELLAVGVFSRAGSMGAMGLSQISGLASLVKRGMDKAKTDNLPQSFVVAVTPERVYVFDYKPRGTSIKVKDPLRIWDRDQVHVHRAPVKVGAMTNTYAVELAGRGTIHIESGRMPGSTTEVNAPVLDLLAA
ncbi:MAG TPA: hypothetical protein PKA98_10115 [Acidimicrobiales bacterium]|nr:hypothetical protein [Acidimicrobiales bacterium]